jgi:hypothetical protein
MAALKDRLARIEDRLLAHRETLGSTPPVRPEPTVEELIETALIMLAYIYEGDTEAFAQFLVENQGVDPEEAKVCAGLVGVLLEERRAVGEDLTRPV